MWKLVGLIEQFLTNGTNVLFFVNCVVLRVRKSKKVKKVKDLYSFSLLSARNYHNLHKFHFTGVLSGWHI